MLDSSTTSVTIDVGTVDDGVYEGLKTLSLILWGASGAAIEDETGIGNIDDDELPPAALSVSDPEVLEGGILSFVISLDRPIDQPVTVHYATANGTAIESDDYVPVSGDITFQPFETSFTVEVFTVNDELHQGTLVMMLVLSEAVGAPIAKEIGNGSIQDDETGPSLITVSGASVGEGGILQFLVSLDRPSDGVVIVDFTTTNGSATAANDYTAVQRPSHLCAESDRAARFRADGARHARRIR